MKRILLTFVILGPIALASTCLGATLLSEDFDDGQAQGWDMLDTALSISGGSLRLVSLSHENDVRAVYRQSTWTNYILEVDLLVQNAGSSVWPATILFRVLEASSGLDNGKYYQFTAGPTGSHFAKVDYSGGWATILVSTNHNVSTGQWHRIRVEVEGTTATAFIDGRQVLTCAGLTHFRNGGIGVKAFWSAQVLYDNVLVSEVFQPTVAIRCSQAELSWDTVTNKAYQLQYRSTLTTNQWVDMGSAFPGTGGRLRFTDDIPEGSPQRFYRIVQTP